MIVNQSQGSRAAKVDRCIAQKNVVTCHVADIPFIKRNGIMIAQCKKRSHRYFFLCRKVSDDARYLMTAQVDNFVSWSSDIFKRMDRIMGDFRDGASLTQ